MQFDAWPHTSERVLSYKRSDRTLRTGLLALLLVAFLLLGTRFATFGAPGIATRVEAMTTNGTTG